MGCFKGFSLLLVRRSENLQWKLYNELNATLERA